MRVSELAIRCPDCGKRMSAHDLQCPTCGYGNVTCTPRIRCNYCARRIPASSVVCPHCQHNPRAFYWKRWHVFVLLFVLVIAALVGLWFLGDELGNAFRGAVALNATATVTSTRPPVTVIIVATRPPASATRVPPTATRAITATPRPTLSPAPTLTSQPPSTQANNLPRVTETFTAIPTPILVPPPKLIAPTDGERIQGANKVIALTFQPVQPLGAQEWYRLQVDYLDRGGNPVSWCAFTKNSALEFPREVYDDSSPNVRSFLWRVNVVRANQFNPATCDAPYDVLSAPSEVWTFYWY